MSNRTDAPPSSKKRPKRAIVNAEEAFPKELLEEAEKIIKKYHCKKSKRLKGNLDKTVASIDDLLKQMKEITEQTTGRREASNTALYRSLYALKKRLVPHSVNGQEAERRSIDKAAADAAVAAARKAIFERLDALPGLLAYARDKALAEEHDLTAKVESLEAENAKLKRRLARYEGNNVLDLTAEDSDNDGPPPRSTLRELHDKETTSRVAQVKKERNDHESRGELLDSMVTPLESQRRELQEIVGTAAKALLSAGVPTHVLPDADTPFYYARNSWDTEQRVPWNAEADRPMTLAEGIAWVHDNAKPPRKRRR
jgi:hypothetical protein